MKQAVLFVRSVSQEEPMGAVLLACELCPSMYSSVLVCTQFAVVAVSASYSFLPRLILRL
jgi:hypothetical protein